MAEVQTHPRPPKQKVGSLDGFLSGNVSSTHASRERQQQQQQQPTTTTGKPRHSNKKVDNSAPPVRNNCGDEAGDNQLTAAMKDQLPSTCTVTSTIKRTKPRSKEMTLRSQSFHIPTSRSAGFTDTSCRMPSDTQRGSSSSSSKPRGIGQRTQSFPVVPSSGEGDKPSADATASTITTTNAQQQKPHVLKSNINRSKSFDSGHTMPLKRIPRNPPRNSLNDKQFPKNPSRRGLPADLKTATTDEKKRRASSKDTNDKNKTATCLSDHTSIKVGEKLQGPKKKLAESLHGSQQRTDEKQASQGRLRRSSSHENTKIAPSMIRRSRSGPRDKLECTVAMGAVAAKPLKQENTLDGSLKDTIKSQKANETSRAPAPNLKKVAAVLDGNDNTAFPARFGSDKKNNYDDDDETDRVEDDLDSGAAEPVGIMQFDPTAANNVKIVREGSIDEFPSDMGISVDMGLGDDVHDDNEVQGNGAMTTLHTPDKRDIGSRATSHSPSRNTAATAASGEHDSRPNEVIDRPTNRWGNFNLMNFKLKRSNSSRAGKTSHDDVYEEETPTPPTMSSVALRLSKSLGIPTTAHTQLDDNMDDSLYENGGR